VVPKTTSWTPELGGQSLEERIVGEPKSDLDAEELLCDQTVQERSIEDYPQSNERHRNQANAPKIH
jgi:hypothetical protein